MSVVLLHEVGASSIRKQLGIAENDPRVFREYTPAEAVWCARVLGRDLRIPPEVRRVLAVGLVVDLLPKQTNPERIGYFAGVDGTRAARRLTTSEMLLVWESVDPALRFDLVHKSVRMILTLRGSKPSRKVSKL